jgi:hypothetical protein
MSLLMTLFGFHFLVERKSALTYFELISRISDFKSAFQMLD